MLLRQNILISILNIINFLSPFVINSINKTNSSLNTTILDYEDTSYQLVKLSTPKRVVKTKIIRRIRTKSTRPTRPEALTKKCGLPDVLPILSESNVNRIVNGSKALVYSWPWIVSIREILSDKYEHVCAGTIISDSHILTAAHCIRDEGFKKYVIMSGIESLSDQISDLNTFEIDTIIIHPEYDGRLKHDLAIIKLKKNLTFSFKISSICLPPDEKGKLAFSKNVVVIGWGSTTGQRPGNSLYLHQTVLKVINNENNNDSCNYDLLDHYCALDPSPLQSNICYGDSGGPMMLSENGVWYLYGISNFLTGFSSYKCDNKRPSYYTIVTNYLSWIYRNVT